MPETIVNRQRSTKMTQLEFLVELMPFTPERNIGQITNVIISGKVLTVKYNPSIKNCDNRECIKIIVGPQDSSS